MDRQFSYNAIILAGICIIVFLLSIVFSQIITHFRLVSAGVLIMPWTLVTHIFLHGDWLHLIYNMFVLVVFGSALEKILGSRRFLFVFFATGIAAGLGGAFFYDSAIGASGAALGIMGCFAVLRPKIVVWYPLGVPMYMIHTAIVLAVLDLVLFNASDNIAHASHLIGLATGAIIGLELRARQLKRRKPGVKGGKEEAISERELDEWEDRYMMGGMNWC